MPSSLQSTTILLVGIDHPGLDCQLQEQGYATVSAADIASIASLKQPYSLALIDEKLWSGDYCNSQNPLFHCSTPAAALIREPFSITYPLKKILTEGLIGWLYESEIIAGLAGPRIDAMIAGADHGAHSGNALPKSEEKDAPGDATDLVQPDRAAQCISSDDIVESITSGLMIIDKNGSVVRHNSPLCVLLKLSDADYVGSPFSKIIRGKMHAIVEDFMKRSVIGSRHHEIKNISVDRTVFEMSLYPMYEGGAVNGVLLIVNDITEQENMTRQLYRVEKMATMGTMLSGIAHELRNPLAIISARAQMVVAKETWERDWVVKNYQSIEAQTYRCATIINNLLDFNRYRATQMALHNVEGILEETLTYIEYQTSFDGIAIEKRLHPGLVIYGDRSRFVQVFLNIISNASDAMQGKGNLTLTTSSETRGEVVVEINDNGTGIDPSIKNNIFDPFFTTKEPGKGTGLGLAVAYKIIHESGGEVWFASEPGNTSFFVKLPKGMYRP
jgi:PAS domain S-box-containing protein